MINLTTIDFDRASDRPGLRSAELLKFFWNCSKTSWWNNKALPKILFISEDAETSCQTIKNSILSKCEFEEGAEE